MKKILLALLVVLMICGSVKAQEVSLGADVVSRYVWRGTDFGSAMSVQPGLSATFGNLEVGTWASYAISHGGADEHDFYASYALGDVSVALTDYYFPGGGTFGFWEGEGKGSHLPELSVSYSNESGLSLLAGVFVYNDVNDQAPAKDQNSTYIEVGYSAGSVDLFVGAGNGFYLAENTDGDPTTENGGFGLVNIGVRASKDIKITEDFTLPMFGSVIINPDLDDSFFFVGFSL